MTTYNMIELWSFSCSCYITFSVIFHSDKGLFSLVGVRRAEIGNRVFEVAELLGGIGADRIVGGGAGRTSSGGWPILVSLVLAFSVSIARVS